MGDPRPMAVVDCWIYGWLLRAAAAFYRLHWVGLEHWDSVVARDWLAVAAEANWSASFSACLCIVCMSSRILWRFDKSG